MMYTTLPGTDLKVSRICLGTWQFNGGKADITWGGQDEKVKYLLVASSLSPLSPDVTCIDFNFRRMQASFCGF